MKTFLLLLFFAFGAGHLAAQSLNPTVRTNAVPLGSEYPRISYPQSPYEIHGGRFIYGGLGIELYQAKNPAKLLQPPKEAQKPPTLADRLWDEGRPEGMSVFSLKF